MHKFLFALGLTLSMFCTSSASAQPPSRSRVDFVCVTGAERGHILDLIAAHFGLDSDEFRRVEHLFQPCLIED